MPTRAELLAEIKDPDEQIGTAVIATLQYVAEKYPDVIEWYRSLDQDEQTHIALLVGLGFMAGGELGRLHLQKDRTPKAN